LIVTISLQWRWHRSTADFYWACSCRSLVCSEFYSATPTIQQQGRSSPLTPSFFFETFPDSIDYFKTFCGKLLHPIISFFQFEYLILTKIVKIKSVKMDSFGDMIRKLREERDLPLRTVAAYLDIDQAILSKVERNHRRLAREYVVMLAAYFKVKENDLLVAWLSDNLVYEVEDEDLALKAMIVAEEKIKYKTKNKKD